MRAFCTQAWLVPTLQELTQVGWCLQELTQVGWCLQELTLIGWCLQELTQVGWCLHCRSLPLVVGAYTAGAYPWLLVPTLQELILGCWCLQELTLSWCQELTFGWCLLGCLPAGSYHWCLVPIQEPPLIADCFAIGACWLLCWATSGCPCLHWAAWLQGGFLLIELACYN